MLDLWLIAGLGFLGSFGHCVGMCSPIAIAFSLANRQPPSWQRQLLFHGLLNLGRILSYAAVGIAIGALGSVLVAGGQMAGVGSGLRRLVAVLTGGLLIWMGLAQINPQVLPRLPLLHPITHGNWHQRLSKTMMELAGRSHWWTPFLFGMVWGLIPCGFLYVAQIKAAETGNLWQGSATLLAFGLGTLPVMLMVGVSTAQLSTDRRSQLYRLGGWLTLVMGVLTLLRTGDTMTDYSGHAALVCLMAALVARPLNRVWSPLLHYRRGLGVGAFVLSLAHGLHMAEHSWGWNPQAVLFMVPVHQRAIGLGAIAFLLMLPLAITSFNSAQTMLGAAWRRLHWLAVPALVLATGHSILIGSHYLGGQLSWLHGLRVVGMTIAALTVLLLRRRWVWSFLKLENYYGSIKAAKAVK